MPQQKRLHQHIRSLPLPMPAWPHRPQIPDQQKPANKARSRPLRPGNLPKHIHSWPHRAHLRLSVPTRPHRQRLRDPGRIHAKTGWKGMSLTDKGEGPLFVLSGCLPASVCETDIDPCRRQPCVNGACAKGPEASFTLSALWASWDYYATR
jgi:hypothetical protein